MAQEPHWSTGCPNHHHDAKQEEMEENESLTNQTQEPKGQRGEAKDDDAWRQESATISDGAP